VPPLWGSTQPDWPDARAVISCCTAVQEFWKVTLRGGVRVGVSERIWEG